MNARIRRSLAVLTAAVLALLTTVVVAPSTAEAAEVPRGIGPQGGWTTAFAGGGSFAPGDGLLATEAELRTPWSIDVGADGDVYIAERDGFGIRRIDAATGIITTVASTEGLARVDSVVVLDDGTLYFSHGFRLHRRDAATGDLTTVAGNGSNPSSSPDPVDGQLATSAALFTDEADVGPDGTIYLTSEQRLWAIDPSTQELWRVAGNGTADECWGGCVTARQQPLNRADEVAVAPDGAVYVSAGSSDQFVYRVDPAADRMERVMGHPSELVGWTDGVLATDVDMALVVDLDVDARGDVFVATPRFHDRVARYDAASGTIDTVVGGGVSFAFDQRADEVRFDDPIGVAVGPDGRLYAVQVMPQSGRDATPHQVIEVRRANAGPDATVGAGLTHTLDGDGYARLSKAITGVAWTQVSGPAVTLADATTFTPSFDATVPEGSQLVFELSITDGPDPVTVTDRVTVTVVNSPPIVDAGPDQTVEAGSTVTLAGTATDLYDPITTTWVQLGGPAVALSDPSSLTPSFTAPLTDEALVFQLQADDGQIISTDVITITSASLLVTVNDPWGFPLADLTVVAYERSTGDYLAHVATDATGVAGLALAPGDVTFRVYDPAGAWRTEWYPDVRTFAASGTITIGGTPVAATMTMDPGASVRGRVDDTDLGTVHDYQVRLYHASGGLAAVVNSAFPNAEWELKGLAPGDYLIRTSAPGYVTEWYQDGATAAGADVISLQAGFQRDLTGPGARVVLDFAARIDGLALDAGTGTALEGVAVRLYAASGGFLRQATSAADGTWSFGDLPPGSYLVRLSRAGYQTEWYQDGFTASQGTVLTVTTGEVLHLDSLAAAARLTPDGLASLSGTVTDQSSGLPIAGAKARVYTASAFVVEATTAADGGWDVEGLPFGTYYVRFSAPGYTNEWFDEAGPSMNDCSIRPAPCTPSTYYATAIPYSGAVVIGIDGTLAP